MSALRIALVLVAACERPDPTLPLARDGGPTRVTIEGVFDALAPCEPVSSNGRLDLASGCADGGCVGMTLPMLEAVWGAATCRSASSDDALMFCLWPSGAWTRLADLDLDGEADADAIAGQLFLEAPYDGASAEGLGAGASVSCFVESLGYPDVATVAGDGGGYSFRYLSWPSDGLAVYDHRGEGRAALLALSGAE